MAEIKNYTDLKIYQDGYKLVLDMYKTTKNYPKEERYEIVSQIRRATYSIPLNIAEGWGRKSKLEFKRFLKMSLGSCNELQVLIEISKDLGYIKEKEYMEKKRRVEQLGKQIYTLEEKWK